MAITVNGVFTEFMNDTVNLDKTQTQTARKSRDNLLSDLNDYRKAEMHKNHEAAT